MQKQLNKLLLATLVVLVSSSVYAAELDFRNKTPTETQIIEHMTGVKPKAAVNNDSDADGTSDGYKDANIDDTRGMNIVPMNNDHKSYGNLKDKAKPVTPEYIRKPTQDTAISLQVLFDYNSDQLTAEAKLRLTPLAKSMLSDEMKGLHFIIEGHTDAIGGDSFNRTLSLRRAQAIKLYLTSQFGVEASRIEIEGKGKDNLADPDHPYDEVNRRVRIVKMGS